MGASTWMNYKIITLSEASLFFFFNLDIVHGAMAGPPLLSKPFLPYWY